MFRWNPLEPARPFQTKRSESGGVSGGAGECGETPTINLKCTVTGLDKIVPFSIMATTPSALENYQAQLVDDALTAGALKFGSFTLKSGRCDQLTFAWSHSAP
jgi:hypothetical protein